MTTLTTSEYKIKRKTIVCPKCGQNTSFNIMSDAIDEEGEVYRCSTAVGHFSTNGWNEGYCSPT